MDSTFVSSPKTLGTALRAARRRKGLTQRELAEAVGIHQPAVSNLERGKQSVSLTTLLRILAALELELLLQERPAGELPSPWEE